MRASWVCCERAERRGTGSTRFEAPRSQRHRSAPAASGLRSGTTRATSHSPRRAMASTACFRRICSTSTHQVTKTSFDPPSRTGSNRPEPLENSWLTTSPGPITSRSQPPSNASPATAIIGYSSQVSLLRSTKHCKPNSERRPMFSICRTQRESSSPTAGRASFESVFSRRSALAYVPFCSVCAS